MSANDYTNSRIYARDELQACNCRVFLGGLSSQWAEPDVAKIVERFGPIEEISVARSYTGESKGYAFVTFATPEAAQASYGHLMYQGRSVESKPSLKQAIRKKEIKSKQVQMPASRPAVAKLSKHSETFETMASLSEVRVKVISLVEDPSFASQSASEFLESLPTSPQSKLRMEDKVSISRLSKEFYPNGSTYPHDYYASFGYPAVYSTAPSNPFQAFSLVSFPSVQAKVSEFQTSTEQLPTKALKGEPHARINFYTFPGRD
jgi:RNA recognition motif-containing protein